MSAISIDQTVLVPYMDDTYAKTLVQNRPFFDRISKGKRTGSAAQIPMNVGFGGGAGGDFAKSLAAAKLGGAVNQAYSISPAVIFGHTKLDGIAARFQNSAPESAVNAMTVATQGAMENAAKNFSVMAFSDGYGSVSTVTANSNPSGNLYILTLSGALGDAIKFDLEQVLCSKATPSSASLDAGTAKIVALNQLGGTITVDGGGTWTPTNGHVIGLDGQLQAGTAVPAGNFPGIFGFIKPITSRNADGSITGTFMGVDQSVAGVASSGWALDGRGKPINEGINTLCSMMATIAAATPDTGFASPITIGKVASEIKTQARYDMKSVTDATVFFAGITLSTGAGMVELLAEPACPQDKVVVTKASTWHLDTPDGGNPFRGCNLDGTITVQDYSTNTTRFSVACSGFFYTDTPVATGVLTITP